MNGHATFLPRVDELAEPKARSSRWPVLAAVLLGLLVAAGGIGYGLATPQTWTAERAVVVAPSGRSVAEQAALYETLSRGQVVATAAEIYAQDRWHPETPQVKVAAGAVSPSAVVQVTATSQDRAEAEAALAEVLRTATPELTRTLTPFKIIILDRTPPSARQTGLGLAAWAGISGLAGLLAGAFGYVFAAAIRNRVRLTSAGRRRSRS